MRDGEDGLSLLPITTSRGSRFKQGPIKVVTETRGFPKIELLPCEGGYFLLKKGTKQ